MSPPSPKPLTTFWLSLPEEIKTRLRLGFTGKTHLLDLAGRALRAGDTGLLPLAVDAIQTAFAENPLDGAMAGELLASDTVRSLLPGPTVSALAGVRDHWRRPDAPDYFELLPDRDFARIRDHVERAISLDPDNLFWREQALSTGLVDNEPDWAAAMMDFTPPSALEPVLSNVSATIDLRRGACHDAARLVQSTGETFGPAYASMRAGLCMIDEDDMGAANLLLLEALARTPWNTSLLLRVHDLLAGWDAQRHPLTGSAAILIYSWNKDVELDATLRSLFNSELSGASIYLLDNGSTDQTAEMLASWTTRFRNKFGPTRFTGLTLPVNVGAPAARNWLMHLEDVQKHDFICYLDDDVELPHDWLLRLGTAVRQYPEAGVWGCKVVDHVNPALIQSADAHLLADPDAPPMDLGSVAPNPFKLSDLHIQSLDSGLFDCLRPCASVTGCCHLFRTSTLLQSGDFALHLSPTQYDDMEHDLRLCESGRFAVYQGHLTVRHKKRSGAASRVSAAEQGNAMGNKYKMQTMHDRDAILQAMGKEQRLLDDDILRKIHVVQKTLI
jgi:hypothetical protein